jgi:hypothetical protein
MVPFFVPFNSIISLNFYFCFKFVLNSTKNGQFFYFVCCIMIQSWVGVHVHMVGSRNDHGCMIFGLINSSHMIFSLINYGHMIYGLLYGI